jgi:hypothetical protein
LPALRGAGKGGGQGLHFVLQKRRLIGQNGIKADHEGGAAMAGKKLPERSFQELYRDDPERADALVWGRRGAFQGAALAAMGAALGAWLAHAMFELEIVQWSAKVRTGPAQWLAEAVATAGLLFVVLRAPAGKAAPLVACYIGAAYWFTASTSFANPAAAFGRMLSNTFAGISPADVPAFMLAELVGGLFGWGLHRLLVSKHDQPHH